MSKLKSANAALLVEVLFSLTLLAFGVTACLRALGQGLEIAKRSQEYCLASFALDELYFRMVSGADETLLRDGGEGEFSSESANLHGLRYSVESKEISPYVPPTEEELDELKRAGRKAPPPDPMQEVEEHYRRVRAKVTWRGGKEELDFDTVVRIPEPEGKSPSSSGAGSMPPVSQAGVPT